MIGQVGQTGISRDPSEENSLLKLTVEAYLYSENVDRPGRVPSLDARYILRCVSLLSLEGTHVDVSSSPETVESLFLAFRLTGDTLYRDQGWAIFQAIEKHCRVPTGGFASVKNVDQVPVEQEDKMETFLMVKIPRSFGPSARA